MAFDGIVTKKITDELIQIKNYKIDKIYQPNKNTIILGLYGNFTNVALLSCISSNNYRIHLTKYSQKNPTTALNFCMLLRKHILGYKIKNITNLNLERIIFIELENTENPDKPIYKKLIIELMGKHSNIILTDSNGIIIDSIRHTSTEEKSQRDIYPTSKYILPLSHKYNLLEISSFEQFCNRLNLSSDIDIHSIDITTLIVNTFNGISSSFLKYTLEKFSIQNLYDLYIKIFEIINSDTNSIDTLSSKDFFLINSDLYTSYQLNLALDDFYSLKESNESFVNLKNNILNTTSSALKKYQKRLLNIEQKLSECTNMDKFKLYGELLTANLYRIPSSNISNIKLENYYDNYNIIEIPLNPKYLPSHNAKQYFKKYSKLKNALEIVSIQKDETLNDIKYIESIIYEIDNSKTINDLSEIYNEISENDIFKIKTSHNLKKHKKTLSPSSVKFNPLKFIIDGYTIYVGRNNKENDYLTNKFANRFDIWFHTKDIHGSHVILKTNPNETVPENILYQAAKLAAEHSKAKNSSNIPVDYCQVRFVKKIPGNKPGLVTYTNNQTIFI